MTTSPVDTVLAAARAGTAGAAELYPALAGARLLFALAAGEGEVGVPWVVQLEGVDHGVICTAPEHADLLTDVPVFAELTGRDLGARWPDGLRALVDPGTPYALVLDADAMHAIGRTPERLPAGTPYAVGAPAVPPAPELVEAVRGALRNVGGVREAYLFQMAPEGGASRLVCGLVLADGDDPAQVVPPIADAVAHAHPAARSLDFLALSGGMLATVAGHVPVIR